MFQEEKREKKETMKRQLLERASNWRSTRRSFKMRGKGRVCRGYIPPRMGRRSNHACSGEHGSDQLDTRLPRRQGGTSNRSHPRGDRPRSSGTCILHLSECVNFRETPKNGIARSQESSVLLVSMHSQSSTPLRRVPPPPQRR
jgi:hypothetical protein